MHLKMLLLFIIIPTASAFVDCRLACRTCRELKAEQTLLEVHCAMCEECKQRRRERMQMKGQTLKQPQMVTLTSSAKAPPTIQYIQPQYPEGCPTPQPCPRSQEEVSAGQLINLDGQAQSCPPVEQCVSNRIQYINSIITMTPTPPPPPPPQPQPTPLPPPPPVQQTPATTPVYIPAPMPTPAPLPLPFPIPVMPPPFPCPNFPQQMETTRHEVVTLNFIPTITSSQSPPALPPSMPPFPSPSRFPAPPPRPPAPLPMPYPAFYPGCYCQPFMGPGCQCGSFHHRPDSGTVHDTFPHFTTERTTMSTKEYFYAYVGVPREILKD